VNETHQLPCLKRKLVQMLYYAFAPLMSSKFVKHNTWNYLLLHIKVGGVVLEREVLHGLQQLERNKYEYIQVEFDPGVRELVSSCGKMKSFTRS